MYGFIATFDERTEQSIKEIWKELKDESISFYAYEVENRTPHITLASYNNLNEMEFIKRMTSVYDNMSTIDIRFNTIGSFFNSGTLLLLPVMTTDIFRLHTNHHEYFESFNDNPRSLYLPNDWIPHCTIANRLTSEKLKEAFSYCSNRQYSIVGKIKELSLIKISSEKSISIIYSKSMMDSI